MTPPRGVLGVTLGLLGWATLHLVAACGDEPESEGQGFADARIVYEASHPALDALLAAEPVDDLAQGAHFLAPADGATLDASTPVTFRWRVGPSEARQATAPTLRLVSNRPPRRRRGSLLRTWLRSAEAHGPPISGRGYYLVAEDEAGLLRYRLWTTELEHQPEGSDWDFLTRASGAVTVTLVNAVFDDDVIADGGGPWRGPSITVSF